MRNRSAKLLKKYASFIGGANSKHQKRTWKAMSHIERGKWSAQMKAEMKEGESK